MTLAGCPPNLFRATFCVLPVLFLRWSPWSLGSALKGLTDYQTPARQTKWGLMPSAVPHSLKEGPDYLDRQEMEDSPLPTDQPSAAYPVNMFLNK